nr:tRNA dihydrouridine synthase DusB [Halioxenophilus sp. WMMB6]
MLTIGPHKLEQVTVLAPMAGVSDRPFRELCRHFGAGLAVSEMVTSDTRLWQSQKSSTRLNHQGETGLRAVQIAGADPEQMANAARENEKLGAQIIDINMGCPAKKVCKQAAGSALLRDENKVAQILDAVVSAVNLPVTLKIRTGWDRQNRNAVRIAQMAEQLGITALTIHGRSRECRFLGEAEYDTIAEVVSQVSIPVIANGDITSAAKAKQVLEYTNAAGVMIGRAAQGRPWLFAQVNHYLSTGKSLPEPSPGTIKTILTQHLQALHSFYGDYLGVRIARKHVGWYLQNFTNGEALRTHFNQLHSAHDQISCIQTQFDQLISNGDIAA